jgi:hypothetical protein
MTIPFASVPRLKVWDDYGRVQGGVTDAHYVLAENGEEYIVKGPSLNAGLFYAAANELVTAQLAELLGLPLLDYRILEMSGALCFGSSWMAKPSFHPMITEPLFRLCENQDRVYDIVALDYWILNGDRHQENLIVRNAGQGAANIRYLLMLNDHSHTLMEGAAPNTLAARVNNIPTIRLQFLADAIVDRVNLNIAVGLIENLSTDIIRGVVQGVPNELLPDAEKQDVTDFLLARQGSLRSLFNASRGVLPQWKGADL